MRRLGKCFHRCGGNGSSQEKVRYLERLSPVEHWRHVPSRNSFLDSVSVRVHGWQRRVVKKLKGVQGNVNG